MNWLNDATPALLSRRPWYCAYSVAIADGLRKIWSTDEMRFIGTAISWPLAVMSGPTVLFMTEGGEQAEWRPANPMAVSIGLLSLLGFSVLATTTTMFQSLSNIFYWWMFGGIACLFALGAIGICIVGLWQTIQSTLNAVRWLRQRAGR